MDDQMKRQELEAVSDHIDRVMKNTIDTALRRGLMHAKSAIEKNLARSLTPNYYRPSRLR